MSNTQLMCTRRECLCITPQFFTCLLPNVYWYLLHLPTEGWPGWVDLGGWLYTKMVCWPSPIPLLTGETYSSNIMDLFRMEHEHSSIAWSCWYRRSVKRMSELRCHWSATIPSCSQQWSLCLAIRSSARTWTALSRWHLTNLSRRDP